MADRAGGRDAGCFGFVGGALAGARRCLEYSLEWDRPDGTGVVRARHRLVEESLSAGVHQPAAPQAGAFAKAPGGRGAPGQAATDGSGDVASGYPAPPGAA